jgi:parvulin-like peptidyl-prolyl isomerase
VISVPDLRGAQSVTDRLAKGDRFEDIAAEISTDVSAARGGLISPMSKLDPGVPAAVREALWSVTTVGGVSAPVLVGTGYVIVRYEGDIPGDGVPLSAVHEDAARAVRIAQERARMDQLAQELVRTAKPTIFDDALADGWNRVRMEATRSGPPPQG